MAATFSYAQAAKGIASTQTSKASSELNTTASNQDEQSQISSEQTGIDTISSKGDTSNEVENATAGAEKELSSTITKTDVSGTPSLSADTSQTSTTSKDEEGSNTPNGTSESTWDKQSQASGSEKPTPSEDDTKEKDPEKEKPAPPKELKAAPLPAVNIWQQRKEAQEAKAKAVAALKPSVSAAKTGTTKATSEASSISGENLPDQSKTASKKKSGDASEGGKDRKKADGAKGRSEAAAVPPVGDAALWPTPQVALGEEKKKAQEKTDKTEKSSAVRTNGKEKWMPVPYVPTAVFNTPLPSAARRGGRAGRVGRDNARNGAAGAAADKASPGQSAQGSTAKQAASGDRGRNEPNPVRANSLPAPSRRSNSAENGPIDTRKPQTTDRSRGPKAVDNANATPSAKNVNGGESFPRHSKPFPRNHDGAPKGGEYNSRNQNLSVDPNAGPRSGLNNERRFENGPKSADFSALHAERDRKDAHKEKDFTRESRADRGRGSNRGRGGAHSAYNGAQNSHFSNNHMSHHNFMHNKSFGFNDRQRSQHGLANGSRGHPMTLRSPSLPNSNAMYSVYPFPADINTMYGGYQPIAPGPMTAVPYQQYMEPYSQMSMISMQLEYYFSVDNLCKDLYLRKHMDTQGFVALNFIAGFKRIKTLTEDFELIRHASRQLRNVEYYVGEDNVDRLRARDKWEQWVLPLDQRDPTAQHNGPVPSNSDPSALQNHADGVTNGVISSGSYQSLANGTATSKTLLSSAAPEFSPSNGGGIQM